MEATEQHLIMYEGGKRYSISGRNMLYLSKEHNYGGEYTFDEAFINGPEIFRDFAKNLWRTNNIQIWP